MKLKEGDLLLVYGAYHLEKAKVIRVDKGIITLSNQMKVDKSLSPINSKSGFTVEPWDESKYEYLKAKSLFSKRLATIEDNASKLDPDTFVKVYNKLEKIISKYIDTNS